MEKKPFWDLEEQRGFRELRAKLDNLIYKVWKTDSIDTDQQVAETLAKVRQDITTLFLYIMKNPQLWSNHPIAFGIVHAFDIHIPVWSKTDLLKIKDPYSYIINQPREQIFNYQEMTPNDLGIIGLNKPKKIVTIPIEYRGKKIDYEIAEKRSIFLTMRNQRTNQLNKYSNILDLAIHEVTHTVCNDVRWKRDNHLPPYQSYHTLMRKWARDCGLIN